MTRVAREGDRVFHVYWGAGRIEKIHGAGLIEWRSDRADMLFVHGAQSLNLLQAASAATTLPAA